MSKHFSLKNLLRNFDLQSYIDTHFDVIHTNNGELRVCCPSCGNTNHKMYVNLDKRVFHCFTCEFSSHNKDFFDLVSKTENIPRGRVIQQFALTYRATTPTELVLDVEEVAYTPQEGVRTVSLPQGLPKLTEGPGWTYLLDRGLTPEEIKSCNPYFTDQDLLVFNSKKKCAGNLKNRVVFPVFGPPGLVSWQGRSIEKDTKVKYLSCPDSDLSKTLWPFVPPHNATAILVEGTIDALAVRRIPKVSAYATFGKKLSNHQISILKDWGTEHVVVFFDKKDAFRQIVAKVEVLKSKFKYVYIANYTDWPENTDAGDCLKKGIAPIESAINNKVDVYSHEYTEFLIRGQI